VIEGQATPTRVALELESQGGQSTVHEGAQLSAKGVALALEPGACEGRRAAVADEEELRKIFSGVVRSLFRIALPACQLLLAAGLELLEDPEVGRLFLGG